MVAVGSGITVSADLVDYPVFAAQALRYTMATLVLFAGARLVGRRIPLPRGRDWLWLIALAASGQALYNVAVVQAVRAAEPAAVAVFVGAVPLLLTLADSIRSRTRPKPAMIVGVVLVVAGAALVQGGGRTSIGGIGWSMVALACEAAFTLLAVPLLSRIGPLGVSAHTCWIAAAQLLAIAMAINGRAAVPMPAASEAFAIGYLAVVLTAMAFVLWYTAVKRLGPATAGLFAGLIPIAGAATGLLVGLTTISPALLGGALLVGIGISLGLFSTASITRPRPRSTPEANQASCRENVCGRNDRVTPRLGDHGFQVSRAVPFTIAGGPARASGSPSRLRARSR